MNAMESLNRVIEGLKCCLEGGKCVRCPYWRAECERDTPTCTQVERDALALLEAIREFLEEAG